MQNLLIFLIITAIPTFIGLMKVFEKAGQKPFLALIPFLNAWIWLEVIEKPKWWFLFVLIPFINVFMLLLMLVETAKAFNKNQLWEQGLAAIAPFYYMPYLGFSKNETYQTKAIRVPFKKSKIREWTDAIIFAVVAASIIRMFIFEAYTIPTPSMEKSMLVGDYLFVSKLTYGARMPNTPIAFPFVHHTMPFSKTAKSFVEWIKFPYYRFFGFKQVKNNDIVVFNYPDGDTVALNYQNQSYYALVRSYGWSQVNNPNFIPPGRQLPMGKVIARPIDKRENYIKRCVAIAGDELEIIDQQIFINGKKAENPKELQYQYFLITQPGSMFSKSELKKLDINRDDIDMYSSTIFSPGYHSYITNNLLPLTYSDTAFTENELPNLGMITLSEKMADILKKSPKVKHLERVIYKKGIANPDNDIFPHQPNIYPWNQDNFGPLSIPARGETIALNTDNIHLYKRIIEVYENHDLELRDGKIRIDGIESNTYTFAMNYYWMMGDNRHNSADSRFWGFVPEDHVSGTPLFIWMSLDKDLSLTEGKIRFERTFKVPE
ncbi:MAG: S26 family signal peptidase [Bacteroidales bacterium]|nr:S26 family signal peptidase [Bacteroidales bacterium]